MKSITRRISKLEEELAPRRDEQGRTMADVLRERMRRLRIAEGGDAEEGLPPQGTFYNRPIRPEELIETLRGRPPKPQS